MHIQLCLPECCPSTSETWSRANLPMTHSDTNCLVWKGTVQFAVQYYDIWGNDRLWLLLGYSWDIFLRSSLFRSGQQRSMFFSQADNEQAWMSTDTSSSQGQKGLWSMTKQTEGFDKVRNPLHKVWRSAYCMHESIFRHWNISSVCTVHSPTIHDVATVYYWKIPQLWTQMQYDCLHMKPSSSLGKSVGLLWPPFKTLGAVVWIWEMAYTETHKSSLLTDDALFTDLYPLSANCPCAELASGEE